MARKKRLPLFMADGTEVRNIDDLKAHFNIGAVVKHFKEGNLLTWLEDRYYDEEAEAIKKISRNDEDLEQKLSVIFGIDPPEEIARRAERLNRLKNYTTDKNILANVDKVAFDQEDLADLLDEGTREIYLCANRFVIPLRMKNKTYIGVSEAVAIIRSKNPVDFGELGIKFKNITFDDDYQKILDASTVKPESSRNQNIQVYGNTVRAVVKYSNMHGIAALVKKASSFKSGIQFEALGKSVDARESSSVINMCMGLVDGTQVTITAYGSDARQAVTELAKMMGNIVSFDDDYQKIIDAHFTASKDSNSFGKAFKEIEEKLSLPRKSNEGIKKALKKLEKIIEQQRNASAMNRIADYYSRIYEPQKADECRRKAMYF